MDFVVRPIRENEWQELRDLRLRALADSPSAFGETLESAKQSDETEWRRLARGAVDSRNFVALRDECFVGMTALFVDGVQRGQLVAVWVAPEGRGHGIGAALIKDAVDFARSIHLTSVYLWVNCDNEPARMLYEKLGFRATGVEQPLPSDPEHYREMEMIFTL